MTTFDSERAGGTDGLAVPPVASSDSSRTFRTEFDFDARTASEAVVVAISRASGCDAMDLPPLYQSVDPDALDAIFSPTTAREGSAAVTFEHADHVVTVDGRGAVAVGGTDRH